MSIERQSSSSGGWWRPAPLLVQRRHGPSSRRGRGGAFPIGARWRKGDTNATSPSRSSKWPRTRLGTCVAYPRHVAVPRRSSPVSSQIFTTNECVIGSAGSTSPRSQAPACGLKPWRAAATDGAARRRTPTVPRRRLPDRRGSVSQPSRAWVPAGVSAIRATQARSGHSAAMSRERRSGGLPLDDELDRVNALFGVPAQVQQDRPELFEVVDDVAVGGSHRLDRGV